MAVTAVVLVHLLFGIHVEDADGDKVREHDKDQERRIEKEHDGDEDGEGDLDRAVQPAVDVQILPLFAADAERILLLHPSDEVFLTVFHALLPPQRLHGIERRGIGSGCDARTHAEQDAQSKPREIIQPVGIGDDVDAERRRAHIDDDGDRKREHNGDAARDRPQKAHLKEEDGLDIPLAPADCTQDADLLRALDDADVEDDEDHDGGDDEGDSAHRGQDHRTEVDVAHDVAERRILSRDGIAERFKVLPHGGKIGGALHRDDEAVVGQFAVRRSIQHFQDALFRIGRAETRIGRTVLIHAAHKKGNLTLSHGEHDRLAHRIFGLLFAVVRF